jgi:hypothetical protein
MKPTLLHISLITTFLAAAATAGDSPFNGKDTSGWEVKKRDGHSSAWTVGAPAPDSANQGILAVKPGGDALVNAVPGHGKGIDIHSTATWGDARIELEVMVPKGSNSGIYVMGEYEVQVFDSFGKTDPGPGDMGGIYGASAPRLNASTAPGSWQKYVIDFQAPRFDASGKKTANARFLKIELNGKVIHENIEVAGPTPGGLSGKEAPTGPILFQGDHGPVAYRAIKVSELPKKP